VTEATIPVVQNQEILLLSPNYRRHLTCKLVVHPLNDVWMMVDSVPAKVWERDDHCITLLQNHVYDSARPLAVA
jgi:hypothetical protein